MSDIYDQYRSTWKSIYRSGNKIPGEDCAFVTYLARHASFGEMDLIHCDLRDKMATNPCCPRHTGGFPISVNSDENTPLVEGTKHCKCDWRHKAGLNRDAFLLKFYGLFECPPPPVTPPVAYIEIEG